MSGLVLKLAPHERILVNGAVIENGNRRTKLNIVTPEAKILRLRDAIHPDDTSTPVKRLCYSLQLILSGDRTLKSTKDDIVNSLHELKAVFENTSASGKLSMVQEYIDLGHPYQALKCLRKLLPLEDRALCHNVR